MCKGYFTDQISWDLSCKSSTWKITILGYFQAREMSFYFLCSPNMIYQDIIQYYFNTNTSRQYAYIQSLEMKITHDYA